MPNEQYQNLVVTPTVEKILKAIRDMRPEREILLLLQKLYEIGFNRGVEAARGNDKIGGNN